MDTLIDPSADLVWGSVGTVIDKSGTHEISPSSDEDWAKVRRGAEGIIAGADQLLVPGRAAAPPGARSAAPGAELEPAEIEGLIRHDRAALDGFAHALRLVGEDALHAAAARNVKALFPIGDRLDKVCESCHEVFWYPKERPGASLSLSPTLSLALKSKRTSAASW